MIKKNKFQYFGQEKFLLKISIPQQSMNANPYNNIEKEKRSGAEIDKNLECLLIDSA
jgi:hypothetical protein